MNYLQVTVRQFVSNRPGVKLSHVLAQFPYNVALAAARKLPENFRKHVIGEIRERMPQPLGAQPSAE